MAVAVMEGWNELTQDLVPLNSVRRLMLFPEGKAQLACGFIDGKRALFLAEKAKHRVA